jgi:hypothetical protein
MEETNSRASYFKILWILLLGLGVERLLIAWFCVGSDDAHTWKRFASTINQYGLLYCYRFLREYNHPPLMGYAAWLLFKLSQATHLSFFWLFKLIPTVGDIIGAWALMSFLRASARPPWVGFVLLAVSPVSVFITSHHGNTDSLCAGLSFLAAVLLCRQQFFWAGLAMAGALNTKLIPLFLALALLVQCQGRRQWLPFVAGLSIGLVPYLPFLVSAPKEVYRNMLAYNSSADHWGLWGVFDYLSHTPNIGPSMAKAAQVYRSAGRWILLASTCAIALWARHKKRSSVEVGTLVTSTFLVLAPGFGVQYLVYPLLFLIAVDAVEAVVFSIIGGAFLFTIYCGYWNASVPFDTPFSTALQPGPCLVGYLVWALLARFTVAFLFQGSPLANHMDRRKPRDPIPDA